MTTVLSIARRSYGGFETRTLELEAGRTGPRFVLLHGFGDSADTWQGVLRELAVTGHSAIAADLPGHGEADQERGGPLLPQLDRFLADIVTEQASHGPVVLVGNSLGSCAAIRAAGNPDLPVAAVVATAEPTLGRSWLNDKFKAEKESLLLWLGARPVPVRAWLFDKVSIAVGRRVLYADPHTADPLVLLRFARYFRSRGGHSWLVTRARALALEVAGCYEFERVGCPVLVVHGAKDRVIPTSSSEELHRNVAGSTLVVHPAWGHCPQLDDPGALTELLIRFTAENVVASPRTPTKATIPTNDESPVGPRPPSREGPS